MQVSDKIKKLFIKELEESTKNVDFSYFTTEVIRNGGITNKKAICFTFYDLKNNPINSVMSVIFHMNPSAEKEQNRVVFAFITSDIIKFYGPMFNLERNDIKEITKEWLKTKDLTKLYNRLTISYEECKRAYLRERKKRQSGLGFYGVFGPQDDFDSDGIHTFDYL